MGTIRPNSMTMIDRAAPDDAEADRLERQWFGAHRAAAEAHSECEVLREVMAQVAESWRDARVRLAELEALRDALGDELGKLDAHARGGALRAQSMAMTAA